MVTSKKPRLSPAEWLYLLMLAALPVAWPPVLHVGGLAVPVGDLIFVAASLAWASLLLAGRGKLRWSWFYLPLALYLAACACSAAAAEQPRASFLKLLGKVYLIGLAVLTFNLVTSLAMLRRVARAWLAGTAITIAACGAGVALFYAGARGAANPLLRDYASLPPGNYPRVSGLLPFPALLCNYLSVSLMLAAMMYAAGWLGRRSFALLAAGIWASAMFSFSPNLGGIYLSLGLWLWLWLQKTKWHAAGRAALMAGTVAALAVFLSAAVLVFARGPQGVYSPLLRGEWQPSARLLTWRAACQTFAAHPIFGRGVGAKVAAVSFLAPSGRQHILTDAHNTALSVAGETGLLGLIGYAGIVIFLLRALRPLGFDRGVSVAIKTCFALALADALFYQSLLGSFEDSRYLWVLFGLIAAAHAGWSDAAQADGQPQT